jgi:hypothetical protein
MKYLIKDPATELCVTEAVTDKDVMRFTADRKKAAVYTTKEDAEKITTIVRNRTGISFEVIVV